MRNNNLRNKQPRRQSKIQSFYVDVVQKTANKCITNCNECEHPLHYSLNLKFSDIAVAAVVFLVAIQTRLEEFENATNTGHFGFVFKFNSVKEIT